MANTLEPKRGEACPSPLVLTTHLKKTREMLLVQQRAIKEGHLDSLEASIVSVREELELLSSYKRIYTARINDGRDATSATETLAMLEDSTKELLALQHSNRALLVEWMKQHKTRLDSVHRCRADIPNHSFPDKANNILIDSEV